MFSFRFGLRGFRAGAKLWSYVALFSLLLAQGVQAAPARMPAEGDGLAEQGLAVSALPEFAQSGRNTKVDFGGDGYNGPVYWDTFPETFQIITPQNGEQHIIPGPGSQVRLLVQLRGEPLAVYRQRLRSAATHAPSSYTAALEAYSAELQTARRQLLMDLDTLGIAVNLNQEYSYLFNGMALSASEEAQAKIASLPQVAGVFPDYQVKATLNDSVPLIGAPDVWAMTDPGGDPVVGSGIRVAIIDTGIDYTHPDLGGCLGASCKVVGGYDFANDDTDPMDDYGHGTHVAGIVAADGALQGVAPGASLLAYKVLDMYGYGTDSDIIAAIEAAANPDGNPATDDAVDVINMSLGGPGNPDDPFSQAVDHAVDLGIVVVVAAGNDWDYFTLGAPASARKAITVAASSKNDAVAPFSSRGPVSDYFDMVKPEVTAPGMLISSTVSISGELGSATRYTLLNGTSMASPHVAGAAALLRQMHPDWSPEAIKASLMNTALDIGADIFSQGAGRIQVNQAVTTTSLVSPGAVAFGLVDVAGPAWSSQQVVTVTNTTLSSLNYTMTATLPVSPTQGISVAVTPTIFTLASAASQLVTLTLTIENALVPYGPPPSMSYEGSLKLDAGDQAIRVPYAFAKSASLVITFEGDELPWISTVHDGQGMTRKFFGSQVLTDTVLYLPPGTYDIVAVYSENTMVFREDVALDDITHIAIRRGDAKNDVSVEALDVEGNPLPLTYETTRGVYRTGWSYGAGVLASEAISRYGDDDEFPPVYHLSDMSEDYFFKIQLPVKPSDRPHDYYEMFYPIDNGLSDDVTLHNDPEQFRAQALDFKPEMGGQPYWVTPMWVIGWPGMWYGNSSLDWAFSSTVTQTVYLPPMLSPFTDYYTMFTISPADDWGNNRYESAMLYAPADQDSIRLSTGSDALPDVIEKNLVVGGAPQYWSGEFSVFPGELILGGKLPGLSDQGMGHVLTSPPFTYTLAHAGTLVEGVLPSNFGDGDFALPEPGVYTVTITHNGYSLNGQTGQGQVKVAFDTTRTDPNPPSLATLNVMENGIMTDTISTDGLLRFSLSDDVALADAALSLKLEGGDWVDLPLTKNGDFYVADLSALKPTAASPASLRITAQDEAGNAFSYEASPAFILVPQAGEIFLPMIVK